MYPVTNLSSSINKEERVAFVNYTLSLISLEVMITRRRGGLEFYSLGDFLRMKKKTKKSPQSGFYSFYIISVVISH